MIKKLLLVITLAFCGILASSCANEEPAPDQKEFEQSQTKGTDLDPSYTK